MEKYKIRVNNEAESKEAQELFFELGYEWHAHGKKVSYLDAISTGDFGYLVAWKTECFYEHVIQIGCGREDAKEITLADLRDMVVLKRNDVKDANYRSKSVLDGFYFKSSDGVFYFMFEGKWVRSTTNTDEGLELITKDPALISGADALRALADGVNPENIEVRFSSGYTTSFISTDGKLDFIVRHLNEKMFRLKPQTVKVELEIPAPFQPKEGEECCYITDESTDGYHTVNYSSERYSGMHFGLYRPSDIKKVVALFRSSLGG